MERKKLDIRLEHFSEALKDTFEHFISLSMQDRITETKGFLSDNSEQIKNLDSLKSLQTLLDEVLNVQTDFEARYSGDSRKMLLSRQSEYLTLYLQTNLYSFLEKLPYFLLINHFLLDDSWSVFTSEDREKVRKNAGLNKPKKKVDALLDLLRLFIDKEVKHPGRVPEMKQQQELIFTALYNRYTIIIERSRADEAKQIK